MEKMSVFERKLLTEPAAPLFPREHRGKIRGGSAFKPPARLRADEGE
jgi:hypothetical protein